MATITKSLTIESQGTYNLTFDLWSYSEWAASAGITTSYASLAALIADEKAVRQLMTVHASVDYFANCPDSTIISTVINNDLCAKWINLRDYALDTLSAKSNIKSVMDTADEYGYGEWVYDGTSWGPKGNVPIMTANDAPYGTAFGSTLYSSNYNYFKVFNGSSEGYGWNPSASDTVNVAHVGYKSVNPICVKRVKIDWSSYASYSSRQYTVSIQGSNTGASNDYTNLKTGIVVKGGDLLYVDIEGNNNFYMYHRMLVTATNQSSLNNIALDNFQFYGRELKPLVPTMTGNTTPKGTAFDVDNNSDAWKAFDGDASTHQQGSGYVVGTYIGYIFDKIKHINYVRGSIGHYGGPTYSFKTKLQYTEDGTTWTDVPNSAVTFSNTASQTAYPFYNICDVNAKGIRIIVTETGSTGRFAMPIFQFYGMDYSEKEFAAGSTRKTIYDHGVKPSGAITGGTDDGNNLTLSAVGTATVTIDKGTRTYMGGKAGLHASGTNRLKCGSGYSVFTASNMPDSNGLDISSISGRVAVGIEQTASGTFDCTEIWLE